MIEIKKNIARQLILYDFLNKLSQLHHFLNYYKKITYLYKNKEVTKLFK